MGHLPGLQKCLSTRVTQGWNDSFWQQIGLDDIVNEEYVRIGMSLCLHVHFLKARK